MFLCWWNECYAGRRQEEILDLGLHIFSPVPQSTLGQEDAQAPPLAGTAATQEEGMEISGIESISKELGGRKKRRQDMI